MSFTRENFAMTNWKEVITSADQRICESYTSIFQRHAKQIEDENIQKIFFLLAAITSFYFKLDTPESPFGPMMVIDGTRTAIPDDFIDEELNFLKEILPDIDDDELRARIADILWLKIRDFEMAELAIYSYLNAAKNIEDFDNWVRGAERIERALQLATMLGKNAKLYSTTITYISDLLNKCNGEDPLYLSAKLMSLLQARKEGDANLCIGFCEKLVIKAESDGNFDRARQYLELKAGWFRQLNNEIAATQAKLQLAETFEKQALLHLEHEPKSFLQASHWLSSAIEAYKKIAGTSQKIEELKLQLREFQSLAQNELAYLSSESVNIEDVVDHALRSVSNRSFQEAIKNLVLLSKPISIKETRERVEENRKRFVFATLLPKTLISANGRVLARQPFEGEEAIFADMYQDSDLFRQFRAQGFIEPARQRILLEHSIRYDDFRTFINNNPLVPAGREGIVIRGLHSGLNGDFLTAVHFLIPQLEESIRYILIQHGTVPSSFDDKGIQDEYNLNKLLTNKKFTDKLNEIFGEDMIFDLRGLLIERFGSNLRNDMAHGLIDHGSFYSYQASYLWWLFLRFYLMPYLIHNTKVKKSMLKFHNTLSGQLEEFTPLDGNDVRLYMCGPTVWSFAHIGNFRAFVFGDILRRYLKFKGYAVTHVMNLTDVDDRIIGEAHKVGKTIDQYTEPYIQAFWEDSDALGIERPEIAPRATEHIAEMIDIIEKLLANGLAYQSEGSIYYRISGFKDYGKLSKINFAGNVSGASGRVDTDKYDKESANDFALWKLVNAEDPTGWNAPFGRGRPGWHIECSAMSMKYLGESFDIHAGGIDLMFPHHENEIAQSEGATGEKPFAKYWLHGEHLKVEGETMSKSAGNYYTFRDLLAKGHTAAGIRYLLFSVPYHKQLNFTFETLKGAEHTIERLRDFRARLLEANLEEGLNDEVVAQAKIALKTFEAAMDDNLNSSVALAALHDLVREINTALANGTLKTGDRERVLDAIAKMDSVFNIFGEVNEELLADDIEKLIEQRQQARRDRDFARSDEIRDELAAQGIILEDTKDGVRWKRK